MIEGVEAEGDQMDTEEEEAWQKTMGEEEIDTIREKVDLLEERTIEEEDPTAPHHLRILVEVDHTHLHLLQALQEEGRPLLLQVVDAVTPQKAVDFIEPLIKRGFRGLN